MMPEIVHYTDLQSNQLIIRASRTFMAEIAIPRSATLGLDGATAAQLTARAERALTEKLATLPVNFEIEHNTQPQRLPFPAKDEAENA